jgi:glycosyltransferase involved in cell wall biosynthesis
MEALCCGTPILASAVGGIKEYTHSDNSITVAKNNEENWKNCIYQSMTRKWNYDAIALEANAKWNAKAVGLQYYNALTNG